MSCCSVSALYKTNRMKRRLYSVWREDYIQYEENLEKTIFSDTMDFSVFCSSNIMRIYYNLVFMSQLVIDRIQINR